MDTIMARKRLILPVLAAAVLIILLMLFRPAGPGQGGEAEAESGKSAEDLLIVTDGRVEIKLFHRNGQAYFFLPSYAVPEEWHFQLPKGYTFLVQGEEVGNGDSLKSFVDRGSGEEGLMPGGEIGELTDREDSPVLSNEDRVVQAAGLEYGSKEGEPSEAGRILFFTKYFSFPAGGIEGEIPLTIMQSKGIAALFIQTESGSMDYIRQDKTNHEGGNMLLIDAGGKADCSGRFKKMKGRGRTSWKAKIEKKPYNLNFKKEVDILNMGASKKWALVANARDGSLIRNSLTYEMASEVGLPNSPDFRPVDLYLNGEYTGNYILCERNNAEKNRVQVGNGGYLIEGNESNGPVPGYFDTGRGYHVEIQYPKILDDSRIYTIAREFQELEDAAYDPSGISPETGRYYGDLIDLDSFARKYLIEEISKNVDCVRSSSYYYKESGGGKIIAGPVWDYDIAYGNILVSSNSLDVIRPEGVTRLCISHKTTENLFSKLLEKEDFYLRVREIYRQDFEPYLEKALAEGGRIDALYEEIADSAAMDDRRYADMNDAYTYVNLNKSTPSEVERFKSFLSERKAFLDRAFIDGISYHEVYFMDGDTEYDRYYVEEGETCPAPGTPYFHHDEGDILKGFFDGEGRAFDPEEPIYGDRVYQAEWE
ncbi:MAG: CotH kinase family protein [Lachnospiraceae bacterium]|nr:CotH kinase family protein [Lachnospiraceae bacterium]